MQTDRLKLAAINSDGKAPARPEAKPLDEPKAHGPLAQRTDIPLTCEDDSKVWSPSGLLKNLWVEHRERNDKGERTYLGFPLRDIDRSVRQHCTLASRSRWPAQVTVKNRKGEVVKNRKGEPKKQDRVIWCGEYRVGDMKQVIRDMILEKAALVFRGTQP